MKMFRKYGFLLLHPIQRMSVIPFLAFIGISLLCRAQEVSQQRMAAIYEEAKTPYKYGLVVAPTDNKHKIDCPTVFREGNKWYMTYAVYNGKTGTDGRGYETWIAESDDLLTWKTLGKILSYRDGKWDCNQRGGFPALPDMEWGGSYGLQSYKGKHWMTYIGGEGTGYEAVRAPLFIGLAWTDKSLNIVSEWEALDRPVLSIHDKDVQWWEGLTQYKSTVYWDRKKTLGEPFVMFYNAGGRHPQTGLKGERVGIALSRDMKHWKRYPGNPVFAHEADGTITGDAHIQKMGDVYVMFYFSAFSPERKYKAFNTFAASYDLVHWTEWKGSDLIVPSKPYDELFAHKSYVVKHNGVVYHFYCAVNHEEQRGIAVATSKPMGRSAVHFPELDSKGKRAVVLLDKDWKTWLTEANQMQEQLIGNSSKAKDAFSPKIAVNLPHNWDDYYGYRQLVHGNLHGTAMYTKDFRREKKSGKRYFLRFEGVGTYATISLNGRDYGRHPVGRTTLTLDVTDGLHAGINNLQVKVEHPEMITDMPWVCGGCSSEWGFSEGSQPFGIFRSVELEETDEVRIEPFGVHVWNNDFTANQLCSDTGEGEKKPAVQVDNNNKVPEVYVEVEVRNYSQRVETVEVVNKFSNADGKQIFRLTENVVLQPGETKIVKQRAKVENPLLWSLDNPYLYQLSSMIKRDGKTTDEVNTPFGIRTISWPVKRTDGDGRFFLNNKPVFINGVCEYEHLFGQSHAFSDEQVAARVKMIKEAGFNAFRDAHQPHNLGYQSYWDKEGILCWTQFSAHIWYDTPEFRENFKTLLRQWVKERRNSPSVVMWGLQNESVLPKEFAEECSAIIREMDPTARDMRVITTCNGGEGTDWNVVQNWSGTYGGSLQDYGKELSGKSQLLNGEYGAWRSIGLHTEPGEFQQNGTWSEERMCQLMEMKIRLAEQVKDSVCGQFQWVYGSHDNPGRRQPDEAYRKVDKVGPFNYKGLVTPWEEPLDVYYMYKSNYVPAAQEPMVYLASHTWSDRFKDGAREATIEVYSNCDSVLLYNDAKDTVERGSFSAGKKINEKQQLKDSSSNKQMNTRYGSKENQGNDSLFMGSRLRGGIGTHFEWKAVPVKYNVLRAVGYYGGKPVSEDILVLDGLPQAPGFSDLYQPSFVVPSAADNWIGKNVLKGERGYNYLYRMNCGGDAYVDTYGQHWMQDSNRYSSSWADRFMGSDKVMKGFSPYQASQGTTHDPIHGTHDWKLFQTFRFGRHLLNCDFPVEAGEYRIELYFVEPWYGAGGSSKTDCEGLRIFDVAVNDSVLIDDLDIWAEAGHDGVCKKVVYATAKDGHLKISFPEVKVGQAIIAGIAIARKEVQPFEKKGKKKQEGTSSKLVRVEDTFSGYLSSGRVSSGHKRYPIEKGNKFSYDVGMSGGHTRSLSVDKDSTFSWSALDRDVMAKTPAELLPEDGGSRNSTVYEAEDAEAWGVYQKKEVKKQTGIFFGRGTKNSLSWNVSVGLAQIYALRFSYMNATGVPVKVQMKFIDSKGIVLKDDQLTFTATPGKWRLLSTTTGSYINAGHYRVVLSADNMDGLALGALEVQ